MFHGKRGNLRTTDTKVPNNFSAHEANVSLWNNWANYSKLQRFFPRGGADHKTASQLSPRKLPLFGKKCREFQGHSKNNGYFGHKRLKGA